MKYTRIDNTDMIYKVTPNQAQTDKETSLYTEPRPALESLSKLAHVKFNSLTENSNYLLPLWHDIKK